VRGDASDSIKTDERREVKKERSARTSCSAISRRSRILTSSRSNFREEIRGCVAG